MARQWIDPRDGTSWLVDTMPFDFGPSPDERRANLIGWTMIFSRTGDHRELPVGYELGADISRLEDGQLIGLLDAAHLKP
jgi:hypothetical protein